MGHASPRAQDSHAAFGFGTGERHIANMDADREALAAIQGLNEKLEDRSRRLEANVQQKDTEIAQLKARLEALEQTIRNQEAN